MVESGSGFLSKVKTYFNNLGQAFRRMIAATLPNIPMLCLTKCGALPSPLAISHSPDLIFLAISNAQSCFTRDFLIMF